MNKSVIFYEIPTEDQAAFRTAVQDGIDAANAGRLSPFEPLTDWLASWGTEGAISQPE